MSISSAYVMRRLCLVDSTLNRVLLLHWSLNNAMQLLCLTDVFYYKSLGAASALLCKLLPLRRAICGKGGFLHYFGAKKLF